MLLSFNGCCTVFSPPMAAVFSALRLERLMFYSFEIGISAMFFLLKFKLRQDDLEELPLNGTVAKTQDRVSTRSGVCLIGQQP
jgi:hypothetical protein